VKLLLDENLSPKLIDRLADLYPGSVHVRDVGLAAALDLKVWQYAGEQHFVIVSKDADFNDISTHRGHPPKVIWLRLGNCSTSEIDATLRARHHGLMDFEADEDSGVLTLE